MPPEQGPTPEEGYRVQGLHSTRAVVESEGVHGTRAVVGQTLSVHMTTSRLGVAAG